MIINAAKQCVPSTFVRNIGFMAPFAPPDASLDVPGHLIAPAAAAPGAARLASFASSDGGSSATKGSGGVAGTPPAGGAGSADGQHILTNGDITIVVRNMGAELVGLRSKRTGLEYMWQGDPKFWGKHSPVLFPIVGRLRDDRYEYKGETYHMKQHGLARTMPFELEDRSEEEGIITFLLRYNEDTLKSYPFKFELRIGYILGKEGVRVGYQVDNLGDEPMPFSIGAHPGFRVPLVPGEKYEDYSIVWNEDVSLSRFFLNDGLIASYTEPLMLGERELRLTRDMFDRDAIVLKNARFERIGLINRETGHGVTMSMGGFPYFGIWAAPGADFVCLEPWCGVGDGVNADGYIEHKEGIVKLGGGDMFRRSFSIKVS